MIKTQYINLDMTPSGVMPVLYCSQYDIGRPLGMVVYNRGEAVNLSTYTCTIEATRTDGTAITATVTTEGNIGAFTTTATMTNQADKYPAKLALFDSQSRRVASLAFVMCVTPKTMDENAESIEEDASLYQQYTGAVQALIADIREEIADMYFDTCIEMKASATLKNGMLCQTAGYHAVGDCGGALYRIYNTVPATHYETLTNGLYAMLIPCDHITPEMYGAKGDGVTDDSAVLNAILAEKKVLYLPEGHSYLCKSDVTTPTNGSFNICGHGTILLDDARLVLQNYTTTQTRDLNISRLQDITVRELDQNSEKPGVYITNGSRINVSGIMIYDAFYGLYVDAGTLGINVRDMRIDNSFIDTKARTGLVVKSGDSNYENIIIREYKIGMDIGQGTNWFYSIHPWIEDFETIYPGSIGFKIETYRGSISNYYNAYLDSFETPIQKTRLGWDKFYGARFINHPSNTVKHPIFTTPNYTHAVIAFDTISFLADSDAYWEIPKNCYFDQINGMNAMTDRNYSQITLVNGLEGELYGRLTNAGLIINGRFQTQEDIPAETTVILFNGETTNYSFNLQSPYIMCKDYLDRDVCFLKPNYSSLVADTIIHAGLYYYINVILPVRNRT